MFLWSPQTHRSLFKLKGKQVVQTLQGLVTQDLQGLYQEAFLFAHMLTPQGRFFSNLMLKGAGKEEEVWLSAYTPWAKDLEEKIARLSFRFPIHFQPGEGVCVKRYKLEDMDHVLSLLSSLEKLAKSQGITWQALSPDPNSILERDPLKDFNRVWGEDPRCPEGSPSFGTWGVVSEEALQQPLWRGQPAMNPGLENLWRILLGLSQEEDLEVGRSIVLEYGFEHLQSFSWTKGCYLGQELMARTHHRGQVRKGVYVLYPWEGKPLDHGAELFQDGQKIGAVKSRQGLFHLALISHEAMAPNGQGGAEEQEGGHLSWGVRHWDQGSFFVHRPWFYQDGPLP